MNRRRGCHWINAPLIITFILDIVRRMPRKKRSHVQSYQHMLSDSSPSHQAVLFVSTWLANANSSSTEACRGTTIMYLKKRAICRSSYRRRRLVDCYQQVPREMVVYLQIGAVIPKWKKYSGTDETATFVLTGAATVAVSVFQLIDTSSSVRLFSTHFSVNCGITQTE